MTALNIDKIDIDLESFDQRLCQLMEFDRATSYAKQKDSLRKEFETFLASLPGHIYHISHCDSTGYLPGNNGK